MTAPRPINEGARVGWGLMAFTLITYGAMVTAAGVVAARVWKRWQR